MAANYMNPTASTIGNTPIYHDFDPNCEWKRDKNLLIMHVPGFKKEHLKVQVNTSKTLKISGDKPLGPGDEVTQIRSSFYKEFRVPDNCNINDIHAKLSDGKLTIMFPRRSPSDIPPPPPLEPSTQPPRQDQRELMRQKEKADNGDHDRRELGCSVLERVLGKCGVEDDKEDEMVRFGRVKLAKKVVVGVGVAIVAMVAIGALVVFKPSSSSSSSSSTSSSDPLVRGEE